VARPSLPRRLTWAAWGLLGEALGALGLYIARPLPAFLGAALAGLVGAWLISAILEFAADDLED